jgi:hypothetical protein
MLGLDGAGAGAGPDADAGGTGALADAEPGAKRQVRADFAVLEVYQKGAAQTGFPGP